MPDRVSMLASEFFDDVLKHLFVETEVGNQLFQLAVPILKLLEPTYFSHTKYPVVLPPDVEGASVMPIFRQILSWYRRTESEERSRHSSTRVPVSAWRRAKAICSSVNFDILNPSSSVSVTRRGRISHY